MNNHWIPKYMTAVKEALDDLENGDLLAARQAGQLASYYFARAVNFEEARKVEAQVASEEKQI